MSDYEFAKVKNKFEANFIFSNINYLNVATNIAWFELLGDVNGINTEVANYKAISAEQVREVALAAFQPTNCSVLYYKKENKSFIKLSNE